MVLITSGEWGKSRKRSVRVEVFWCDGHFLACWLSVCASICWCLFISLQVDVKAQAIKPCLLTLLFSPFLSTCHSPYVCSLSAFLLSFFPFLICFSNISCYPSLCPLVVDTALPSTSFSLCLRPTTGPPSVFVFQTFTLNSSCLSTTSWSGTVQHLIPLP